jgi:tRNA (guanine26-N2/guanine27-N2)-dimethyltransferase
MSRTEYHLIKEGTTELFVINKNISGKGPSSKDGEPFYNPAMELNRDVSILLNQWFINTSDKPVHFLDGLAASGIRGIRMSHELTGDFEVTVNDWNAEAFSLIQQNIQKNPSKKILPVQKDLNNLLSEHRYDSIDIDPFGSPVYFLDSAIRSIYHNGIIACTATDTAALCGVFPKVCFRRYGAWPLHVPCMHEIGLRILVGVLGREAAKHDKGVEPLLCYTTDHYLRLYVKIKNGKHHANESMAQYSTLSSEHIPLSKPPYSMVGPLWLGPLQNKTWLHELRTILNQKELHTKNQILPLLYYLEAEADAPAFFYTTNDLSSVLKQSPPPMERLFESLQEKGFVVTKTHCTPTGFKTNAPYDVIKEVFK